MVKKFIVLAGLLLVVGFSFTLLKKSETTTDANFDTSSTVEVKLPQTVFTFKKETLTSECALTDKQFCAVETAVKCTIDPELKDCRIKHLPRFIFMQDPGLDRPTEISYKIIAKKALGNNTTEIHTDSTCNGGWFGLCQGTVIYVLAKDENTHKWFVKDIYAIE